MCSPDPLLMTDFANTLATVWLLTLKSLVSEMTNETSKCVDNAQIVLSHVPTLKHCINELKYLISEGMGNRTAKSLFEFFKARELAHPRNFLH